MEFEIEGTVCPNGRIDSGRQFSVRTKSPDRDGRRRFEITLEPTAAAIAILERVDPIESTDARDTADPATSDAIGPEVTDFVKTPPSFVVTTGYTKPPGYKEGHHGFTFVAVGEVQGGE